MIAESDTLQPFGTPTSKHGNHCYLEPCPHKLDSLSYLSMHYYLSYDETVQDHLEADVLHTRFLLGDIFLPNTP